MEILTSLARCAPLDLLGGGHRELPLPNLEQMGTAGRSTDRPR